MGKRDCDQANHLCQLRASGAFYRRGVRRWQSAAEGDSRRPGGRGGGAGGGGRRSGPGAAGVVEPDRAVFCGEQRASSSGLPAAHHRGRANGPRILISMFRKFTRKSNRCHLDRHSYVLGVGGGAVLDVAGLAAATAHRGVRHVRIPTTTLSQCDAGWA